MGVLVRALAFGIAGLSGCRGDGDALLDDGNPGGDNKSYPKDCADIYDETLLPTFDVEISQVEWAGMQQDCEQTIKAYRPIVFHYGGESTDAMMRLKGNWSWSCKKMQFVISFNETNSDGRFHGLRKIVLDAPWYDPTFLHERLGFYYLKRYGAPSSCVNNARLNINGEYYGLYADVERIDREYLERNFDLPDGNLYKEGVELVTNEDSGDTSHMEAFWAATDLSQLKALVDLNQAVAVWAGESMIPDPDSYWAGVEINFYLYDHPTRGFLFLPYDADMSFADNLVSDLASAHPITYENSNWLKEAQFQIVLSDTAWCKKFVSALDRANDAYDPADLLDKTETWFAQIADAAAEDPNKTFTLEEHLDAVEQLRQFPALRKAFIESWIATGNPCPPQWR